MNYIKRITKVLCLIFCILHVFLHAEYHKFKTIFTLFIYSVVDSMLSVTWSLYCKKKLNMIGNIKLYRSTIVI